MKLPLTERERLIAAALRVIHAEHYQPDDNPNGDAEAEYAEDRLTAAARAFVSALDKPRTGVDDDPRTAFTNALHEVAVFLTDHPDVPIPSHEALTVFPRAETDAGERAMVDAAAKAMGTTAGGDTHYETRLSFGPLGYEVIAISRRELADHKKRQQLGQQAFDAQREAAVSAGAAE